MSGLRVFLVNLLALSALALVVFVPDPLPEFEGAETEATPALVLPQEYPLGFQNTAYGAFLSPTLRYYFF